MISQEVSGGESGCGEISGRGVKGREAVQRKTVFGRTRLFGFFFFGGWFFLFGVFFFFLCFWGGKGGGACEIKSELVIGGRRKKDNAMIEGRGFSKEMFGVGKKKPNGRPFY